MVTNVDRLYLEMSEDGEYRVRSRVRNVNVNFSYSWAEVVVSPKIE